MSLEKLLSLVLNLALAGGRVLQAAGCLSLLRRQLLVNRCANLLGVLRRDVERAVEAGHGIFHAFGSDGPANAVVGLGLLLDAHEVVVCFTALASVAGEDEPSTAG
ncbi:hypothetical protein AB0C38_23755 [Amycolatopsis sp. NPDC048633]|uniref:hypothetical protein n=1 Tax=Amycolatopsis sp. NPDC048633 TaxID=3157095 RepID=UPI0033D81132